MAGSEPLEEPCLGAAGLLRQNGDVDLLYIRQVMLLKCMEAGTNQTYSSEPNIVDHRFQHILDASKCTGNTSLVGQGTNRPEPFPEAAIVSVEA